MTALSRSRRTTVALVFVSVLVLTVACGSDAVEDNPTKDAASGGETSTGVDGGAGDRAPVAADSTPDQSRSKDADTSRRRTVNGGGCSTDELGPLIATTTLSTLPAFTGGVVRDGVYDAKAHEIRIGTSRDQGSWTLAVRGNSYSSASLLYRADPVVADFEDRGRGDFSVAGTVLSLRRTCGGTELRAFDYTATERELVLHSNGVLWKLERR